MNIILKIALLLPLCIADQSGYYQKIPLEPKIGPRGMPHNKTTSCQEFGKFARFNPYSVVGHHWFVFYYWSLPRPQMSYKFRVPSKRDTSYLHYLLDGHVADSFNWSARMLLMVDQEDNTTSLLLERGDRGQYHLYELYGVIQLGKPIQPNEVRVKQVGDNKYLGFMICRERTAYILSKIEEIPPKKLLQEEASKLGYKGRKGKSYLYQGNEWMPIPEFEEEEYWDRQRRQLHEHYLD